MPDAHDALLRGLKARLGEFHELEVREARSQRWHSATFSGSRHHFALTLSARLQTRRPRASPPISMRWNSYCQAISSPTS